MPSHPPFIDNDVSSGNRVMAAWLNDVNDATYKGTAVYTPAGTGAVPTTMQAKFRDIVSIKDFGAVGNGSADDTLAIQTAVNQLISGQSLYFPTGTYKITNEITLPDTVAFNFFGDGKRASKVVQYTANKNGFTSLSTFNTGPNECSIRDMGISASSNTSGYGLDTSGIKRSNFLNVEFGGWGYLGSAGGGVRIFNSLILTFTNCSFYSCYYGIFNEEGLSTNYNGGGIFGCTFEDIKAQAFSAQYTSGISIIGNTIESCYGGGILIGNGGGGLVIHGNYFEQNLVLAGGGIYYDIYIGPTSYVKGVDICGNFFNGKVAGETADYVPIRVKFAYGLTVDANDLNASATAQLLKFDASANVSEVYLGSIGFNLGVYSTTNTYANLPTNFYITGNNVNIFNQIVNVQPTSVRAVTVPVSLNVFTTAVVGTGAVTGQGIGTVLSTGGTASSTALAHTEGMGLSISQGQINLDWTKSFIADFYISNINSGTANGNTWVLLSKVSAASNPTDNAAGFRIDGNALKGIVCNSGGTPTVVDLATNISSTLLTLLRLESSNGQNWSFYVNGVLKGSTFLVLSGQVPAYLSLAVANNADAALQRVGIYGCDIRVNQT
jgi:Pectate lyase superfamily protein